jgi:hypothetical protein
MQSSRWTLCAAVLAVALASCGNADSPEQFQTSSTCEQLSHTRLVRVSSSAQLRSALSSARPGDLIELSDATFGSSGGFQVRSKSGTPAARITLCGSRAAVINVGSTSTGSGLLVTSANYWTFTGFTITNALFGVFAESSSYNLIQGLEIHAIGQEGIEMFAVSRGNVIRGNRIYDTGLKVAEYGEGIYVGSAYEKWCTYTACAPDPSDSTLIEADTVGPNVRAENIDIKEGTTGGEIRGNVLNGLGLAQNSYTNSWLLITGSGYSVHDNSGTNAPPYGYRVSKYLTAWGNNNTLRANTADMTGGLYGFEINTGSTGNVVGCDNVVVNAQQGFANVPCQ